MLQNGRLARPQRVKSRGVPSGYVEGLNDARTLLADIFSILLEDSTGLLGAMQQGRPQTIASPGRLIPRPVQQRILGMRNMPLDRASEPADAQGEASRQGKIPQEPEFCKIAGIIRRVAAFGDKMLASPDGHVRTPSIEVQAGRELIPPATDNRRAALCRFVLAGQIECHHINLSKPGQVRPILAWLERELGTERRQEIIAGWTIAGNPWSEECTSFGILGAAGMGPVDLTVE